VSEYKATHGQIILHYPNYPDLAGERQIPKSLDNRDYLDYLEWEREPGNQIDPADPLPPRSLAERRSAKAQILHERAVKEAT